MSVVVSEVRKRSFIASRGPWTHKMRLKNRTKFSIKRVVVPWNYTIISFRRDVCFPRAPHVRRSNCLFACLLLLDLIAVIQCKLDSSLFRFFFAFVASLVFCSSTPSEINIDSFVCSMWKQRSQQCDSTERNKYDETMSRSGQDQNHQKTINECFYIWQCESDRKNCNESRHAKDESQNSIKRSNLKSSSFVIVHRQNTHSIQLVANERRLRLHQPMNACFRSRCDTNRNCRRTDLPAHSLRRPNQRTFVPLDRTPFHSDRGNENLEPEEKNRKIDTKKIWKIIKWNYCLRVIAIDKRNWTKWIAIVSKQK